MLLQKWDRTVLVLGLGLLSLFAFQETISADDGSGMKGISWRTRYAEAAEEAAEENKPLLIEFTAVWCGACQQMQQLTFRNSRLIDYVDSNCVPLVIDADEHPDLVSGFHVEAFPTTLVVSPDLKIIKRFSGYQSAATLLPELQSLLRDRFGDQEAIQPVSAERPANTAPYAFDGFCLVGILEDQKLRRGKPEFTATYRDQVVCFYSEEHQKKFQANPDKYWPVANGHCLVSEREEREVAVGDPRLGVTWKGRLWLFADRESQRRFIQSPRKYLSSGM